MEQKFKKKWGDRYDGRRVRHGDPTNIIIPFLMKDRDDSQVFFDAEIDVSKVDAIIQEKRKEGIDIGFLDYLLAALVRTISQYPRMNRFIAGRRIYARDDVRVSMAVKKRLSINTEETNVKFNFPREATVNDINKIIREEIAENKGEEASNDMDKLIGVLNKLPRWFYSMFIGLIEWLDFHGKMPKFIHEVSPFHTSVFVTNMGSIGAEPIYHHLYNFGTTSVFIALGNRRRLRVIDKDGKVREKRVMRLRFTADERIADGYYLSVALKYFTGLLTRPEELEAAPEEVKYDDQI
ncbi:MAG: 2-oxo acid dehydrogenase subunit E2 [Clostridia bacterium]|nr:2-oxo acid dehydrogenase subunit E2 [Clostridia bacterium]